MINWIYNYFVSTDLDAPKAQQFEKVSSDATTQTDVSPVVVKTYPNSRLGDFKRCLDDCNEKYELGLTATDKKRLSLKFFQLNRKWVISKSKGPFFPNNYLVCRLCEIDGINSPSFKSILEQTRVEHWDAKLDKFKLL